ncbi:MAG: Cytidylate kinase [Candidatus Roizmanbacteria bacterium GW2011_GWA2_36_23]|uniref:Cytidylate kinase n=1 Tax=Candidatus Roizmanbacteria bacterium GW2011_GWA2_36_23 TaxID=1618480 RepID=A0A0G0EL00_9BACT|nr:MAG: Cytidylate kinase [Candidatus Roizmanbacteria bacterium GW2011_GWA2_36_23]
MDNLIASKYRIITVSGKVAVGTSTLAKNLQHILGWKHINVGEIQRKYDRENKIHENKQGALSRSDKHEREIDSMTKKMLVGDNNIIYEAWLAGFMANNIQGVLKVLLVCSHEDIRIDRVVNRDNITVDEAKHWIKQRESENFSKWQKLYGLYDFWDPKYYDLVIDTYKTGPMETAGKVLDKLGYRNSVKR